MTASGQILSGHGLCVDGWVRPCQHEIYVTTATQPGWNQLDQPAPAARLGWVSGKDKRYLMSWVWLGCSAIALVLVLWAKHVA